MEQTPLLPTGNSSIETLNSQVLSLQNLVCFYHMIFTFISSLEEHGTLTTEGTANGKKALIMPYAQTISDALIICGAASTTRRMSNKDIYSIIYYLNILS